MGKSNRIKSNKATQTLATPKKACSAKKGLPTWAGTLIVVAVLLVLVLVVTLSALNSRGTFNRMRVIARSENYKVTIPMMSYMVYTEYQNLVSTYDNLSSQLGTQLSIPGGTNGKALDTSLSLREQNYSVSADAEGNEVAVTWFDHFVELAKKDVEEILACCEFANYYDIELGEDEYTEIDATIEALEAYAQTSGYTTAGYVQAMYGKGVMVKDVRAMMELSLLANKYNQQRSQELLDAVGDDRVNDHYLANKDKYDVYMDYATYTFTATFTPSTKTGNEAKTENQTLAAEYAAKQAKYAEYVKQLGECTTKEAFNIKLDLILQELFLEEEVDAAKKDKKKDELTENEMQECRDKAQERRLEALDAAMVTNGAVSDVSDTKAADWLKDTKAPRKAGDNKTFIDAKDQYGNEIKEGKEPDSSKGYAKSTSTYSVYLSLSALHRDESTVRSVGHILFKTDTFKNLKDTTKLSGSTKLLAERVLKRGAKLSAEEMANELVTLMKEEGKLVEKTVDGKTVWVMDENDFKAYGMLYTEDSNVFYDDVKTGQMVAEFEDWLFDDVRVEGEVTVPGGVKSTYGYHVMLYRGDEKPAWSFNIRTELAEDDHEAWLEDAKALFGTTFTDKDSYWDRISA